jgi:carboxypeptidase Q
MSMNPATNAARLREIFLVLCLVSLAGCVCAESKQSASATPDVPDARQENFSRQLMDQLETIKEAALTDDYAYQQLTYLTENIGPRSSGSAGAKAAVEYVAAQMRKLGLDVHLEEIKVRHWVRGAESAELIDVPGSGAETRQKVVLTALGGSTSTGADGIKADVVVVENFEQLKTLGRSSVTGKIVLFNEKFDRQKVEAGLATAAYREIVGYRETGPKAAAELGAVATLVRSVGSGNYRLPHTGDSEPAGIPAAAVSSEDADLVAHLAAKGPVRMRLTLTPQKLPNETSYNVIGDLQGSEHPEEIVIVSGHLDSWDLGTGAIDDGAGVVVAMETAQMLQHLHLRPKRTLRVIAWMDEETDGVGSTQYKKDYSRELEHHVAAIECDAGAAHPLGFLMKMNKSAADVLTPVKTVLSSIGATVIQDAAVPSGVTDVMPLSEHGVPVLGIMQDGRNYFTYHHTAADTLDKVVPSELRENAAAMAVMAYALANMKNRLPR